MNIIDLNKVIEEPLTHNPKINKKVIIKKKQIPNLERFSQTTLKTGQVSSEHIHEHLFEIFLIEEGTGIVKVEGQVSKIEKGNCIIIEPGEGHEFLNTGKDNLVLTYFALRK